MLRYEADLQLCKLCDLIDNCEQRKVAAETVIESVGMLSKSVLCRAAETACKGLDRAETEIHHLRKQDHEPQRRGPRVSSQS